MIPIFYIAAIIATLSSIKVISCVNARQALLYLAILFLATSTIFCVMGAYFAAILMIILFVCAAILLFLFVISLTNLRRDVIEQNKRGINPKIWLGPLILAFVLLVTLVYQIVSTDYSLLQVNDDVNATNNNISFTVYIIVAELAILLLFGGLVIAYHFIHRIYINNHQNSKLNKLGK